MLSIFQKKTSSQLPSTPAQGERTSWHLFQEGELLIDMYERTDALVIRSLIAGVNPENLEVSVHDDLLTIRGMREEIDEAYDDQFYHRECYWGSFRRTIVIPIPVDAEGITASVHNGVVIIELPKQRVDGLFEEMPEEDTIEV